MTGSGSSPVANFLLASTLLLAAVACGDNKNDPKSPKNGQDPEMKDRNAQGGGDGLPPLEEVEPAKEDVEVPPAP